MKTQLNFANDYLQGAHPNILKRMMETNQVEMTGYGTDPITKSAIEQIREACDCLQAEVRFLMGGTQSNQIMIDSLLQSYQGTGAQRLRHQLPLRGGGEKRPKLWPLLLSAADGHA